MMDSLEEIAPAFIGMAHTIVWCSVATVDSAGRPRSRILHPFWEWDGSAVVGWIATAPTPLKRSHIAAHPYVSCSYWAPTHDTCLAECGAAWSDDEATRRRTWDLFANGPVPVGYDPSIVPGWTDPMAAAFLVLRLTPWRLRVFPGTVLLGEGGRVMTWSST